MVGPTLQQARKGSPNKFDKINGRRKGGQSLSVEKVGDVRRSILKESTHDDEHTNSERPEQA